MPLRNRVSTGIVVLTLRASMVVEPSAPVTT